MDTSRNDLLGELAADAVGAATRTRNRASG